MVYQAYLDALTQRHTAFPKFSALLHAPGGYWPSLRTADEVHGAVLTELADGYDAAQEARGDPHRPPDREGRRMKSNPFVDAAMAAALVAQIPLMARRRRQIAKGQLTASNGLVSR